jgi:hypothetical protein
MVSQKMFVNSVRKMSRPKGSPKPKWERPDNDLFTFLVPTLLFAVAAILSVLVGQVVMVSFIAVVYISLFLYW